MPRGKRGGRKKKHGHEEYALKKDVLTIPELRQVFLTFLASFPFGIISYYSFKFITDYQTLDLMSIIGSIIVILISVFFGAAAALCFLGSVVILFWGDD